MDNWNTATFDKASAALTDLGDTSVWSLIVTVMGDLAPDGTAIGGPFLAEILEPFSIKPEALRVALHRLRKDGWILSEKLGRTSQHRLTEMGQVETRVAARRIYQRQGVVPEQWYLLWEGPEGSGPAPKDVLPLGRGMYLGQGAAPEVAGFLVMQGHVRAVPDWLKSQLDGDALAVSYARLADALTSVISALDSGAALSPQQVASLRIMIVHHWRRNLLKHADLPAEFYPDGWQGELCRDMVIGLLDRLAKP